jgi:hypothetical protein
MLRLALAGAIALALFTALAVIYGIPILALMAFFERGTQ